MLHRTSILKEDLRNEMDSLLVRLRDPEVIQKLASLKNNSFGALIPDYVLTDMNNKQVKLSQFRGKVVILDFYFTGCDPCRAMAPALKKVEEKYQGKDVVFLSISTDTSKDKWLKSVQSELYSSPLAMNLYTSGNGREDKMVRGLNINDYPTLILNIVFHTIIFRLIPVAVLNNNPEMISKGCFFTQYNTRYAK